MKPVAVLLNPAGGKGRARRVWAGLQREFPKLDQEAALFVSRFRGEIELLARRIAEEGYEKVLVLGGDGTLFEAVNGFVYPSGQAVRGSLSIAALPAGSGCDFLRSFPLPKKNHSLWAALQNLPALPLDLLQLDLDGQNGHQRRFCLNTASLGISGEAAHTAGKRFSFLPAAAGYLSAFFAHLLCVQPVQAEVTVDGEPWFRGAIWNLFLCNGRYSGGGMLWAPEARLDDGKADLLLIRPVPRHRVPGYVPRLFRGTLAEVQEARSAVAEQMEIRLERAVQAELDGELFRFHALQLKVLPGILPWILPRPALRV